VRFNKKLARGSLILLISFGIFNVLNFVFHFFMVRMLSVSDYGIVVALFSIVYVLAIFSESIQTLITKYSSREEKDGKVKNLIKRAMNRGFSISLILFIGYSFLSLFLAPYLGIRFSFLMLMGVSIFFMFAIPVTRGVLQGRKKFGSLGINMGTEAFIKLLLAVILVYLGLKVYGAILGIVIGSFAALAFSFIPLKKIMSSQEEKVKTEKIYAYSRPTFVIVFTILIFFSMDVLIAKIVFSAEVAGTFAIASVLAKSIFLVTNPISKAMFPLSASGKNKKEYENVFGNALSILVVIIVLGLAALFFFPSFIINIFSGKSIPDAASILIYIGIAMSLVSFANLVLLYKLSIGKTKNYIYLLIFPVIEIVLLAYFRADIFQFSIALMTASAIFLWGCVVLLNK